MWRAGLCLLTVSFVPALTAQQTTPPSLPPRDVDSPLTAIEPLPSRSRYIPMMPVEKLVYNVERTFDGGSLFRTGLAAGIDQAMDNPDPWPNGVDGYGIRYTSKIGHRLVKHVIMSGVQIALKQDPRHIPTESTTVWGRTKEAILNTYRIYNDGGGMTFNYSRLVGAYGSAFVSRTWQPRGYNTAGDALVSGTITLGLDAGMSVFYEFWPDLKRLVFRTK
jgi:hypothetical protein